jgi:hypothetical protein
MGVAVSMSERRPGVSRWREGVGLGVGVGHGDVCLCVYYCSTYYKAVRVGEGC